MRTVAIGVIGVLLGGVACSTKPSKRRPPPPPTPAVEVAHAPSPTQCTAHQHVCRGDNLVECDDVGQFGATIQTCKDGCRGGACADACAMQGSELVYVVTDDKSLLSFDPQKLPADPFHPIGRLACDVTGPNSMAVDHSGIAWVVDHHRHLFRVSILDGHCSAADAMVGAAVPATFGMGFASNGRRAEGTSETLYVATDDNGGTETSVLGRVDTTTSPITYRAIAPITARGRANAELSGTGDGDLFGYFPLHDHGGFIQQIDRATGGAIGQRWPVPSALEVQKWAFAQWGGVFYVFATTLDGNSQVHAIDRKTGAYKLVREHLPYGIVGAGVSTCAPELEHAGP